MAAHIVTYRQYSQQASQMRYPAPLLTYAIYARLKSRMQCAAPVQRQPHGTISYPSRQDDMHPTDTHHQNRRIYIAIAAISLLIFGIDLVTRLGITEWVFYLIPVVLSKFQKRRHIPFVVAILVTALMIIGYFVSPDGIAPDIALINRCFGVISIFIVAYLAHRVIDSRLHTQRLLWLQHGQMQIAKSILGAQRPEEVGKKLLHA